MVKILENCFFFFCFQLKINFDLLFMLTHVKPNWTREICHDCFIAVYYRSCQCTAWSGVVVRASRTPASLGVSIALVDVHLYCHMVSVSNCVVVANILVVLHRMGWH